MALCQAANLKMLGMGISERLAMASSEIRLLREHVMEALIPCMASHLRKHTLLPSLDGSSWLVY